MTTTSTRDAASIAVASIQLVATGTRSQFDGVIHPDAVNRESAAEPPATRGRGPEAYFATALWLRTAFSDLAFTVDTVMRDDDLVAVHCTMSGRSTGEFEVWTPAGGIDRVFPATGRSFAVRQAHFLRVRDGQVIEHWAVRDDQAMALQIGWMPPSPAVLLRSSIATWRAKRRVAKTER